MIEYLSLEGTLKDHGVQLPAPRRTIVSMSSPHRDLNDATPCCVAHETQEGVYDALLV